MHQSPSKLPLPADEVFQDPTLPAALSGGSEWSDLPAERREAIKDYYGKLSRQFPHMKEARLLRKVGEYFKINFVLE